MKTSVMLVALVATCLLLHSTCEATSMKHALGAGAAVREAKCQKLGKDITNPSQEDCVKCVAHDGTVAGADRECVFAKGTCWHKRFYRGRSWNGAATNKVECREDFYSGTVANAGGAALGFEFEFGHAQLLWGKMYADPLVKNAVKKPSLATAGVGEIMAVSDLKLGPGNNLDALAVTVDLGNTLELVSGPIPKNDKSLGEFYQALHTWAKTMADEIQADNCKADDDGSKVVVTNKGETRGKELKYIMDKYNSALDVIDSAGTGAAQYKLKNYWGSNPQRMKKTKPKRFILCAVASKSAIKSSNPQINFGLKVKALGKTTGDYVKTMSQADTNLEGKKLYTNIQKRLDAWLAAQPTLAALKADLYMRAIFQTSFYIAATNAYWDTFSGGMDDRGFKSKNVANSMVKGSVQDMIRASPQGVRDAVLAFHKTTPTADAIASFFCANDACDNSNSLLKGIGSGNWLSAVGTKSERKKYKAAFQSQMNTALTTCSLLALKHQRYGNVEDGNDAKYADHPSDAKPPGSKENGNWAVKADACYALFKIDDEWSTVVEARLSRNNAFITPLVPDLNKPLNVAEYIKQAKPALALLNTLNE